MRLANVRGTPRNSTDLKTIPFLSNTVSFLSYDLIYAPTLIKQGSITNLAQL